MKFTNVHTTMQSTAQRIAHIIIVWFIMAENSAISE